MFLDAVGFTSGACLFILLLIGIIKYIMYVSNTIEETGSWGFATFVQFKYQFAKSTWEVDTFLGEVSLYDYKTNSRVLYNKIQFYGEGMILDPISYALVHYYVRRKYKKKPPSKFKKRLWTSKIRDSLR